MAKVVINAQYGGFGISKEGMQRYCEIKNIPCWIEEDKKFTSMGIFTCWIVPPEERIEEKEGEAFYAMSMEDRIAYNKARSAQELYYREIPRDDPALVQLIEEDADRYSGRHATLKVVEIPDDVEWEISEYDGYEHVAEVHRTWS